MENFPLNNSTSQVYFKKLQDIIVYENDDIVAINKPAGLLTIPDRTQSEKSLKEFLQEKFSSIFVIHRLDKDTSGLVIFAKNEIAHKYYSALFQDRKIKKYYVGIVVGSPEPTVGEIEAPIAEHGTIKGLMTIHRNGKPSHTSYEVLQANRSFSLLSFELHTGRTHQIRLHAKTIGHPLACDTLYGDGKAILLSSIKKNFKLSQHDEEERPLLNRLALHSYKLCFEDINGKPLELIAGMPKEFKVLMQQLKKYKPGY